MKKAFHVTRPRHRRPFSAVAKMIMALLSLNLVAADVRRLILFLEVEARAASRRLLRFKGSTREALFRGILSLATLLLTSGCAALLPSSQATTKSRWKNYEEAKAAFDQITPSQTRTADLKALGFDPSSPNVKVLTYLDVIQRFMPNQSITKEDLDKAVRECIEAREGCHALELELNEVKGKRIGNVLLDVFGFRRKTHETGWRFKALLLLRDDAVVYKLFSGEPAVDRFDKKVKPLGPLQELDSLLLRSVPSVR